jgi:hypothetical protein
VHETGVYGSRKAFAVLREGATAVGRISQLARRARTASPRLSLLARSERRWSDGFRSWRGASDGGRTGFAKCERRADAVLELFAKCERRPTAVGTRPESAKDEPKRSTRVPASAKGEPSGRRASPQVRKASRSGRLSLARSEIRSTAVRSGSHLASTGSRRSRLLQSLWPGLLVDLDGLLAIFACSPMRELLLAWPGPTHGRGQRRWTRGRVVVATDDALYVSKQTPAK